VKIFGYYKRGISRVILCALFLQVGTLVGTSYRTIEKKSKSILNELPEYISISDCGLRELITQIVHASLKRNNESPISEPLFLCYERIIDGHDVVRTKDLIQALPEIFNFILQENTQTKIERPDAQEDVVGQNACNTSRAIKALLRIQKAFGSVNDSSCCNTVLGILGDACEILGPDQTIAGVIKELIDLTSIYTTRVDDVFTTLTECCADLEEDFRETWTIISEIKDTVTECCAELEEDFRETWTIVDGIQNQIDECCEILQEDFRETWTILDAFEELVCDKFEQTWTIIQNKQLIDCLNTETNFQETWTILAAFEETFERKFQETWTILADITNTVTECCADLVEDFRETWTILDAFQESICDKFEQTWTILANLSITATDCCGIIEKDFQQTWTALEENRSIIKDKFNQTWTELAATETTLCEKFDLTFSKITDIEELIMQITTTEIQLFNDTFTTIIEITDEVIETFSKILDLQDTLTELLFDFEEAICDKFEQTWTIIGPGFENMQIELFDTKTTICEKFDITFTVIDGVQISDQGFFEQTFTIINGIDQRLCKKFQDTWTLLETSFASTLTSLEEFEQNQCNKFEGTWTALASIETFTLEDEFRNTWTAIQEITDSACEKFRQTWTALGELKQTVTECCEDLREDFRETWTILDEIESKLCPNIIRQEDIPFEITTTGLYCLGENITFGDGVVTQTAIAILSDDVVLDLQDHSLTSFGLSGTHLDSSVFTDGFGAPGTDIGIYITNVSNVVVKNGSINQASVGLQASNNVSELVIDNVNTNSCTLGILWSAADNVTVQNSRANYCEIGITGSFGSNWVISNCIARQEFGDLANTVGIRLASIEEGCVKQCISTGFVNGYGVFGNPGNQNDTVIFEKCIAKDNSTAGFNIDFVDNLGVFNCQSLGNSGDGFRLDNTINQSELRSNSAIGNSGVGFNDITSAGSSIEYYNNIAHDNDGGNFVGINQTLIRQPSSKTGFYTNVTQGLLDPVCSCTGEFSQTWTILDEQLQILCDDFEQTWTILQVIENTLEATFTVTALDLTPIFTALDQFEELICDKFIGTWTILDVINASFGCTEFINGPTTITESGKYCLSDDIVFDGATTSPAIDIQADNVVIDMRNFSIRDTSAGGSGAGAGIAISASGQENITIKNGEFSNPAQAISLTNCNFICIENIKVGTAERAVNLSGCNDGSISNLSAFDVGAGVQMATCSRFSISNVYAERQTVTPSLSLIQLVGSSNICLTNGLCLTSQTAGMEINSSQNISVFDWLCKSSVNAGYLMNNTSSNVSFTNCKAMSNSFQGFNLLSVSNFTMRRCETFANSNGIEIASSSSKGSIWDHKSDQDSLQGIIINGTGVRVSNAQIMNSGAEGIEIFTQGSECVIKDSQVNSVGGSGIVVNSSDNNHIIDCDVVNCAINGIDIRMGSANNVVRNCNSINNGTNGFINSGGATNLFYYNQALLNGTNFGAGIGLIVAPGAVAATTGSFANVG